MLDSLVGPLLGCPDGSFVGITLGSIVGSFVGVTLGIIDKLGSVDGVMEGLNVGEKVSSR